MNEKARQDLIKRINEISLDDDKSFRIVVAGIIDGGLYTEQSLANELQIPRPVVSRWKKGTTAPGKAMRKGFYDFVINELESLPL